jgi:hypothetical protein
VCDALTEHLRQWPSDDLVFTAPDGGPVRLASWRSRFFKRAVDAAGVAPLRVHDYADVRVMPMSASTSCSPVVSVLTLSA